VAYLSLQGTRRLVAGVFTNEGTGTLVVSSIAALSDAEQGSAQQSA